MKGAVVQRLKWMASLESANIVLVPACACIVTWSLAHRMPGLGAWAGLVSMGWLLYQGADYWRWKAGSLEGRARPFLRRRFLAWKRSNGWFMAFGGLLVASLAHGGDLWIGGAAWTMAVLEHVNYYHLQLMHDTPADWGRLLRNRRLRPSPLAKDLAKLPIEEA